MAARLERDGDAEQVTDELIGQAWQVLEAEHERVRDWVRQGLTVTNIRVLLERRGVVVPYRTLHRLCEQRCGFGKGQVTVRVADGEPGRECQLDFARIGWSMTPRYRRANGA